jgi:hypothetical protein
MEKIGLWQINQDGPQKIKESVVDLESKLEDWIEKDPSLLRAGLVIIGRQIYVEGGRLDLLALDPLGRFVVIEIKRGELRRDTVAQALDYASSIATMPLQELHRKVDNYLSIAGNKTLRNLLDERGGRDEETEETRDIIIFIVGAGKALGLERMVNFLADQYRVPVNLVSFEVFELEGQNRILVRELTESEFTETHFDSAKSAKTGNSTIKELIKVAEGSGIGDSFKKILDVAERHGIYPRIHKTSIMYTPPAHKNRMLFTVWANPDKSGKIKIWLGSKVFAEFYPVTEETAIERLGENEFQAMDAAQVEKFTGGLEFLFEEMENAASSETQFTE